MSGRPIMLQMVRCTTICDLCGVTAHWTGTNLPGRENLICTEHPEGIVCLHWLDHDRALSLALTTEGRAKFGAVEAHYSTCQN